MKILIVIDAQNDFVNGKFGSAAAQNVVDRIKKRIEKAKENKELVIFTQDTHAAETYNETYESTHFPIHCEHGTEGFDIVDELKPYAAATFRKTNFCSPYLINMISELANENEELVVEICGFCTDICVVSNALMLRGIIEKGVIKVNKHLCAGTSKEKHRAALKVMESCLIEVIGE